MDRSRSGWKSEAETQRLPKTVHRFFDVKTRLVILSKVLHRMDLFLLRLTDGRHTCPELAGLPVALLPIEGAKAWKMRILPPVSIPAGDKLVLVATSFGHWYYTAWYYNLKVHPRCKVTLEGCSKVYIAREAGGMNNKKYWQLALSYCAGYQKYRERAAPRLIPILALEQKK